MKKFEDLFAKTPLLLISAIIAIAVNVAELITELVLFGVNIYCIPCVLYAALTLDLLVSYRKGETTVQKTLMGALLLLLLEKHMETLISVIEASAEGLVASYDLFFAYATAICYAVIFSTHLIMQHDHKGRKLFPLVNQIALPLLIVLYVASVITCLTLGGEGSFGIFDVFWIVSMISLSLMLVCMETRIQKYKRYRKAAEDAGNWNEETRKKAKKIFSFDV